MKAYHIIPKNVVSLYTMNDGTCKCRFCQYTTNNFLQLKYHVSSTHKFEAKMIRTMLAKADIKVYSFAQVVFN